ncbi:MAG: response regulator transcription factor [Saprospiraceae bacterium]|nr:response regulator transcription factor [Saprospiraceae bacterium]
MDQRQEKKTKCQDIVEVYKSRTYYENKNGLDIDQLKRKYQLFPNEMLYIIDCRHAQMESLCSNFARVLGIDRPHKNELGILYEHIHIKLMDVVLQWVVANIKTSHANAWEFQPEEDIFRCIYLTTDNRVILKSVTGVCYDENGTIRYTLGKLTDLTGLVTFQHFIRQFEGPNRQLMNTGHAQFASSHSGLTTRESEILELIGQGKSSVQIGRELFISNHTVDTHRRNIIQKLEVNNAVEAYCKSKNLGWL